MKNATAKIVTMPRRETPQAGRRERRRRETREKIFRAALRLFAEQGFLETTTQQITEAADVGEGTFFNYFPTKGHVLTVLADIQLEKITEAMRARSDEPGSTREQLRRLMHAIAAEPGNSPALARSLVTAFTSNEQVREIVGLALDRGRKGIAHIIGMGQLNGEIRRDRSTKELATTFQKIVLGTMLLWSLDPKGTLRASLEQTFLDFWAAAGKTERP
jgi:AcrR family transcriptional regulator